VSPFSALSNKNESLYKLAKPDSSYCGPAPFFAGTRRHEIFTDYVEKCGNPELSTGIII
jgi:hypothetical protein